MTITESPYEIESTRIGSMMGREEEGECLECGSPQYVRDHAFQIVDPSHGGEIVSFAFCSRRCATDYLKHLIR